jgi:hypothetical protein
MPTPYCFVHKRLFNLHNSTWMLWDKEHIATQQVGHTLEAAPRDVSRPVLMQTACDRCAAIARQAICEQMEPL